MGASAASGRGPGCKVPGGDLPCPTNHCLSIRFNPLPFFLLFLAIYSLDLGVSSLTACETT